MSCTANRPARGRGARALTAALLAMVALCAAVSLGGCVARASSETAKPRPSADATIPPPPWINGSVAPDKPGGGSGSTGSATGGQTSGEAPSVVAGTVVYVVDGDTAHVQLDGGPKEKVRFIGIDTPESTRKIEPFGKEASAFTKRELMGKRVWLERDAGERDRYGRLLAYVWLAKPSSSGDAEVRAKMFNARLALKGYAGQMTIPPNVKYADNFRTYVAEARDAGRGLWGVAGGAGAVSAAPPAAAPAPSAGSASPSGSYIGNRNTMKFHRAGCSSVSQMSEHNKVPFSRREDAIAQGYVGCKNCKP